MVVMVCKGGMDGNVAGGEGACVCVVGVGGACVSVCVCARARARARARAFGGGVGRKAGGGRPWGGVVVDGGDPSPPIAANNGERLPLTYMIVPTMGVLERVKHSQ